MQLHGRILLLRQGVDLQHQITDSITIRADKSRSRQKVRIVSTQEKWYWHGPDYNDIIQKQNEKVGILWFTFRTMTQREKAGVEIAGSLVWQSMPLILVLQRKRLTQVGLCESEACLAYTVVPDQPVIQRPCMKKKIGVSRGREQILSFLVDFQIKIIWYQPEQCYNYYLKSQQREYFILIL